MDKDKIDFNAPAFGPDAQKVETEPSVEEQEIKDTKVEEKVEEESKVPYSRFKKFHDEALQLRREAEEWRTKADKPEPKIDLQDEAYKLWIENFGDTEASKKAWANQLKITQTLEDRALERARSSAIEAVKEERQAEVARVNQNLESIDSSFENLDAFVGHDLSEAEQSAILDIVDDYTPKDEDGNYSGPLEKAWEIYNLKQESSKFAKRTSRNAVASLAQPSQGEPNADKNKDFDPRDWNAYQKRL